MLGSKRTRVCEQKSHEFTSSLFLSCENCHPATLEVFWLQKELKINLVSVPAASVQTWWIYLSSLPLNTFSGVCYMLISSVSICLFLHLCRVQHQCYFSHASQHVGQKSTYPKPIFTCPFTNCIKSHYGQCTVFHIDDYY